MMGSLPTGVLNSGGVCKFCDFLSNQPHNGLYAATTESVRYFSPVKTPPSMKFYLKSFWSSCQKLKISWGRLFFWDRPSSCYLLWKKCSLL